MEHGPGGHGSPTPPERYRFGAVVVDAVAHTLSRDGQLQAVEPKAFAVLLVLLRHAGELLPRDQLLDEVWGHRHVTPGVLTRAIAQLRGALDDDSHDPRYIQTQHALGYRFIGQLQDPASELATDAAAAAMDNGTAQEQSRVELRVEPEPEPAVAHEAAVPVPAPMPVPVPAQRPAAGIRQAQRRYALSGLLLLLLLAIGLTYYLSRERAAPLRAASIAVVPFVNLSSQQQDDYFAEGLAVEMHDALASVEGLRVAAPMQPRDDTLRNLDARALGAALDVASVLEATVRRDGERVRISANLVDTRTGYTLWNKSYDRTLADVFDTQRDIANDVVMELMGGMPASAEAMQSRLAPTRNVQAYDAYLKGLQKLNQDDDGSQSQQAIGFFNEALAQDRDFVNAQVGICRSELARFNRQHEAAALERADQACGMARQMAPRAPVVALVLGDLARSRQQWPQAEERYGKAAADQASRADAYVGLALVARDQQQAKRALDYFEKALELRPGDARIYANIAYSRHLAGDSNGAIEAYRKVVMLDASNVDAWANLGGLYQQQGRNELAEEALRKSLQLKPSDSVLSNLGQLRYEAHDYPAAIDLYQQAIQLDDADYLVWGNLGDALQAQQAPDADVATAYRTAAEKAADYLRLQPGDALTLSALAWYRLALGESEQARLLAARASQQDSREGEAAFFNALTFARLGDATHAGKAYRKAIAAGIPRQRFEVNPLLVDYPWTDAAADRGQERVRTPGSAE